MTGDEVIARRYARGLAEHAVEAGVMAEVRRDLKTAAGLMDSRSGQTYVPELISFLESPLHTVDEKTKAVSGIMGKIGIGRTVTDFVCLLVQRGRVALLPKVLPAFALAAGELTGEHTAVVQTARPLTADQENRLQTALNAVYGGVVHIHQRVEPRLLGGAKVVVGDQTFDGTVLGKLDAMRQKLTTGDTLVPSPETPVATS